MHDEKLTHHDRALTHHGYQLKHLSDEALLRVLAVCIARDRISTATLLAVVAEVDARRLYVPAGYPSMFAYCVDELELSEDAAYKRIQAARAARQFPVLFAALAEGRLHLAAICLITPHLTAETAEKLIEAATHRRKSEIEEWLARRFPAAGRLEMARPVATIRPIPQHAPGHVGNGASHDLLAPGQLEMGSNADLLAPGQVERRLNEHLLAPGQVEAGLNGDLLAPGQVGTSPDKAALAPGQVGTSPDNAPLAPGQVEEGSNCNQLAPGQVARADVADERYLVKLTISKSTHDKLRYAQALLSHTVPARDVAQLLDRALDSLIAQIEKRKIGAVSRQPRLPRSPRPKRAAGPSQPRESESLHRPARRRYIPAPIRRAVWERDQGQCTFVSAAGHRCTARELLEFDHVDPVARGGKATVDGMRLRCHAHNQYEAEQAFGADFMRRKRGEAQLARGEAQAPGTG